MLFLLSCKTINIINFIHSLQSASYSNPNGGVMVSVLVSNAVDCGFHPRPGKTTDYKIGFCCFYAKHPELRSEMKD